MNIRVTLLLLTTVAGPALAQPPAADERWAVPNWEVAAFAGYRFAGSIDLKDPAATVDLADHGTFAVAVDLARDADSQYELFYSRQPTHLKDSPVTGPVDLDVEYLHVGGTLLFQESQRLRPYIIGTLGVTRLSPDSPGADADTNFSVSLGGGVRVPLSARFTLRLEARGYMTFVNTSSALFCTSGPAGGACRLTASGQAFSQYELLAGAAFAL
jgi:hypothetical protein